MDIFQKRRSFLALLSSSGLLGAVGMQTPASGATNTVSTTSIDSDTTSTTEKILVGVELINKETGERSFYTDHHELRQASLAEGEYDVLTVFSDGDQIVTQSEKVVITDTQQITTASETTGELRVFSPTETIYDHYAPDGTVVVQAGAVEQEDGIDRHPIEDVEIEFELRPQSGDTIATTTETTGSAGSAGATFDLAELDADIETGSYVVEVSAEDFSSAETYFNIGPYISPPFHWTAMTPGEDTTIGYYAAQGGVPESDVTYDIEIEDPNDNSETQQLDFDDGGIGLFSFTPDDVGTYRIDPPDSPAFRERFESAELKALTPYFEVRDQFVETTVSWGGFILSEQEPVAGLDLTVTVETDEDRDLITEETVTTNDFGQFVVEFEAPDDTDIEYSISLEADDGRSIFLFGHRVRFNEQSDSDSGSDPAATASVDFDDFTAAPESEQEVEIEVLEDGEPVVDQTVNLYFSISFDDVPDGTATVETDAEGKATYTVELPDNRFDAERFYASAIVDLDDETTTGSDSVRMEQYDIDSDTFGLIPGETNTIDVTASDRETGDPVSDIDITMFGNRDNVDLETFDADYAQTNDSGEAEIELSVPDDATNSIHVNELTPYSSTNSSAGSLTDPFTTDITVSPESPSVGETVTVNYTTDSDAAVSALVYLPRRNGANTAIIEEGEDGELTVPNHVEPGSSESLGLLLVSADGKATQTQTSVDIADGLVADFSFSPTAPAVDEEVSFDATTSSDPDGTIESFEWDFTGDGEIDETGEEVTYTFTEETTYEVTLTVTSDTGEEATTTANISVGETEQEAFFSVEIIDPVDGQEVRQDTDLIVTADVENTGTETGTQTVELTEPIELSTETTDLEPDTISEVEFTIPESEVEGDFDISVATEDASDTVSVTAIDPCFIATAAYGSPAATEIDVLREFRDDVLRRNRFGTFLIQAYYRSSPPVANWIRNGERRQQLVKDYFVSPLVKTVEFFR